MIEESALFVRFFSSACKEMERKMKCPFLIVPVVPQCVAEETPYMPSSIQLKEYCRGKESEKCPFYRASMNKRNPSIKAVMKKAVGL
jgi:hypothetical protein